MRIHLTTVEAKDVRNSFNSSCDTEEMNKTPPSAYIPGNGNIIRPPKMPQGKNQVSITALLMVLRVFTPNLQ